MRSFLFIPGDSPKKLDKGMGSGADALLLDLEDSISPQSKAEARATTLAFLKEARSAEGPPSPLRAHQRPCHRPDRRRSRRRGGGQARRHHVSQGRGRRRGRPLRRQDHRAGGDPRPAGRRARHHRHRHRNRAGDVPRRHLWRLKQAAEGPDLGRRGSFGRARRRGQPRPRRQFPRAVSAGAQPLPRRRGGRPGAGDRHGLCGFSQ